MQLSDDTTLNEYWKARLLIHYSDTYRGRVMRKFPEDLRTYQHLIEKCKPEVIVELGTYDGGSAQWFSDQLNVLVGGGEVITVDMDRVKPFLFENIIAVTGDLGDRDIVDRVHDLVGGRSCMVVDDSAHTYKTTRAALALYSDLVKKDQYFVVEDGIVDEENLRTPKWPRGVQTAVTEFCEGELGQRFARQWLDLYGLTCNHGGYLQAVL